MARFSKTHLSNREEYQHIHYCPGETAVKYSKIAFFKFSKKEFLRLLKEFQAKSCQNPEL
jgi:hypothetical protein